MKNTLIYLVALCYSSIYAATVPTELSKEDQIKQILYNEEDIVYRGQYDIAKIYFPIFLIELQNQEMLFVVEAEKNSDSTIDKGLYVIANNVSTKLLDNGRDVDGDNLGNVYFAASDGVYKYDRINNVAVKFSSLSESIISIAAENGTSVVYALSENHVLYRMTMNDVKAYIDDRIRDAEDIAIDIRSNSLFYYNVNKTAYVVSNGTTTMIQGFPTNPSKIQMIKAPIVIEGMVFLIDNDSYLAFPNGTSKIISDNNTRIEKYQPTAYSLEGGVILYYSYDKKVYRFNLLEKIITSLFKRLNSWITEKLNSFAALFSN